VAARVKNPRYLYLVPRVSFPSKVKRASPKAQAEEAERSCTRGYQKTQMQERKSGASTRKNGTLFWHEKGGGLEKDQELMFGSRQSEASHHRINSRLQMRGKPRNR
jgi:hypothetical protein